MINKTESLNFKAPLTLKNYETAKGFSKKEKEPSKSRKIYLKVLAAIAVYYYCQCMDINIDLEQSDVWNPLLLRKRDTADLEITGIGKLECRPVLSGEEFCYIPQSVWEDRVGYVVVQIDESSNEATLLGFVKEVTRENLPISELQPLEDLLIYLEGLEKEKKLVAASETVTSPISELDKTASPSVLKLSATPHFSELVKLGQWLKGMFEEVWQPPQVLVPAFRGDKKPQVNPASRAKVIDLGMEIEGEAVALVVYLTPQLDEYLDILLRVFPAGNLMYLPQKLQLIALDDKGTVLDETTSRTADNWIQLKLKDAEPGDKFSVKIALGDFSITENFII